MKRLTTFGENLKKARIEKGLLIDEVCKKYNYKYGDTLYQSALIRYENNLEAPPFDTVVNLAGVYEIPVEELISGEKDNYGQAHNENIVGTILFYVFGFILGLAIDFLVLAKIKGWL